MTSGSKDQTTRVWDIETQKQVSSRKIDRNVITYIKWLPDNSDSFIECSEDLTLRLWDVRQKPFKPAIEIKVGTNFATNCDINDHNLVTGHRGFNNEGAEVKLWDLRHFKSSEDVVFTYKEHKFSPESVRFASHDLIVSAAKDQTIHLIDMEGKQHDCFNHKSSFASMTIL